MHENEPAGRTHSYEWFHTKTRFDTEAKGNSEVPFSLLFTTQVKTAQTFTDENNKKLYSYISSPVCSQKTM